MENAFCKKLYGLLLTGENACYDWPYEYNLGDA